ncbi:HAD-IIB family hydrolase [Peptostreptococcus equinus]|uniref:HAD-IIB family hydrolase n=1 Tax=Peptostreptococcus equinus TaxID=3003601 RepID=A0ABY7JQE9_9FIRM|nr:HAD-IIB family hydrolase [Peptostreptococcus sp. CBA3647]WAW15583.1 HAD-IIB family hydrolase [Peptostreptococcus sp. CBA3647]
MGKKKYFFFDIDGTIAVGVPRIIPESTAKTLKKLKENGHFVSLATGRMHIMTTEFCEELGIENLVTDGGNGIVLDGKVEILPLEQDMVKKLINEFEEKDIPWAISLANERLWHTKDERFPNAMNKIIKLKGYMETKIVDNLNINDSDKIYKAFAYLPESEEYKINALKNSPYTRYGADYIIIEPDDKSKGIRKIMEKLNIKDEDVVVFGDNTNDIKMFRPEWTSIAMGNAHPKLKEIADFVTKDADDDGIEYACKHFGWI